MPVISTCEHRLPWESRCRVVFLCPSLKGKEKIASHSLNLCVSSGAGGEESPINWSEERGQANYSFSLDFGLAKEQERLRHYRRFVHEKGGIEDVDQRSVATGRKTGKAKGRDDGYEIGIIDRFRFRTRYFTDSGIIGSKAFVARVYRQFKDHFSSKNEKQPRAIKGLEGLFSLKRLSETI
jgi:hypothetical protein